MTILVTDEFATPTSKGAIYKTEKISAYINVHHRGSLNVHVTNSKRRQRSIGRGFPSFEAARAAYKSADMKAIFDLVEGLQ